MMQSVSLSSSPVHAFSLYNNNGDKKKTHVHQTKLFRTLPLSSSSAFTANYSLFSVTTDNKTRNIRPNSGVTCYASAPLAPTNLQWISTISSLVLMFASGTGIQKSFIVPVFALQAPASIISWIKGEFGLWSAFLAILVRLFFFIPGELELPYVALLLVIVAPYEVMKLRGTQEGTIFSLVISGYLAFQHFSRAGSLRKAFDQGSIVATLAIICITAISCLLLI